MRQTPGVADSPCKGPRPSQFDARATRPQADKLRHNRRRLLDAAERHGVDHVRAFGSVARGEATADSDVDLLVDLKPSHTLLDLAAFRREAGEMLDLPVDVATVGHAQGAHPRRGGPRGPPPMSREEKERLRDIQDAIAAIREHLAKGGRGASSQEGVTPARRASLSVRRDRSDSFLAAEHSPAFAMLANRSDSVLDVPKALLLFSAHRGRASRTTSSARCAP